MITANYINDRAAMHGEEPPYKRVSLVSVAVKHKVEYENKHTALGDCIVTAEVYRQMISTGLFT